MNDYIADIPPISPYLLEQAEKALEINEKLTAAGIKTCIVD